MKPFAYRVTAFKQHPKSQLKLLTFVAPAEHVVRWAGVPRKTELGHSGMPTNFQRALDDDRVAEIGHFLEEPHNLSPTSVVIAFRQGAAKYKALEKVAKLPQLSYQPDEGIVTFNYTDLEKVPFIELLDNYLAQTDARLNEAQEEEEDAEEVSDASGQADTGPNGEFVLYDSHLRQFAEYVRSIRKRVHQDPTAEQQDDKLKDLRAAIIALSKPAMIVDGQHRLFGAAELEQSIPFTVNAVLDCSWAEQVFQFVVVNQKAKPIPPNFLSSITSTSLTSNEVESLRDRLASAGINVMEHEMMDRVGNDPESPFKSMVNFGVLGEEGRLPYPGIKALANAFRTMAGEPYKTYFRVHIAKGDALEKKMHEWRTKRWLEYFFAFWGHIRDKYDTDVPTGEELLWRPDSQLLRMKTLDVLQRSFVEWMLTAKIPLPTSVSKFKKECVERWISDVPRAFFVEPWRGINLGSKEARDVISDTFQRIQRDPSFRFRNSRLFQATKG